MIAALGNKAANQRMIKSIVVQRKTLILLRKATLNPGHRDWLRYFASVPMLSLPSRLGMMRLRFVRIANHASDLTYEEVFILRMT